EVLERVRGFREHLGGEDLRALGLQNIAQAGREQFVRASVIDAVDDAVDIEVLDTLGDKVKRDVRREGPVEQPRWQTVVLREGKPVPDRITGRRIALRVLAEVAQEVVRMSGRAV